MITSAFLFESRRIFPSPIDVRTFSDRQFVRKHAIKFPSEEFALALGLALPRFARKPCPLGLRDGFLNELPVGRM